MTAETPLLSQIRMAVSRLGARLFRNQVGHYVLIDGRRLTSGLCKGSSDLIGWTPVEITREMVGSTLAVFTAIEAKAPKGRTSKEQEAFIKAVQKAGGIAGVARSTGDAERIISAGVPVDT